VRRVCGDGPRGVRQSAGGWRVVQRAPCLCACDSSAAAGQCSDVGQEQALSRWVMWHSVYTNTTSAYCKSQCRREGNSNSSSDK
jgi:hypothetical protein